MGKGITNPEFAECLKKNRIREFSQGQALVNKEFDTAKKDLISAKDSLKGKNFKWAIVQAYYSMFHLARALLYNKNYREKSHHCLIIALNAIYVETNELSLLFLEGLKKGKNLRENADYYDEWSLAGANEMISLAEGFLGAVKKILKK